MTNVAAYRGLSLFMTIDTPLHLNGLLQLYDFLQHDVAMAPLAFDFCGRVFAVTEECEIG